MVMSDLDEKRKRTLESLERRLDELPLLPSVLTQILTLTPEDPSFAAKMEDLARRDPPLATRLLRLANSAASGSRTPITTLAGAIGRVGARPLAEMVTSLAVMSVFVPKTVGQRNLWLHAMQVAVAARLLAMQNPELEVEPEQAYLAGLLHDVGRFVMFRDSPTELGAVDEAGPQSPRELVEAEVRICGYDHAELGWLACRQWRLPDKVATLIRDHHVYHDSKTSAWSAEMQALVRVVQQADSLSFGLLTHPGVVNVSQAERDAFVRKTCFHPSWRVPRARVRQVADMLEPVDDACNLLAHSLALILPKDSGCDQTTARKDPPDRS